MRKTNKFAAYPRLNPLGIGKAISAADLIDQAFLAYNGGRLAEACRLFTTKMIAGRAFQWDVVARDNAGRQIAATDLQTFHILTTSR